MVQGKLWFIRKVHLQIDFIQYKFRPTHDIHLSLDVRKPVFGVSNQVRHRPGCAITEYGYGLEILDLRSRGIVLSV